MISIIVPIYNSGRFLEETLISISNQTYQFFEVLLIDDGSTDDTKDICLTFVDEDERFQYHYKENSGVADTRNLGLSLARGTYIAFVDSDDTVSPEYLKCLYDNLVKFNVDISICNMKNKNGEFISLIRDLEFCNYQNLLWSSSLCNKLYKKKVFKDVRFPSGMLFEDNFIFHQLFGNDKYNLCLINQVLYSYRHNEDSITRKDFSSKRFNDFVVGYKLRMDFFKERQLLIPYKQAQYELVDYLVGNYIKEKVVRKDKEIVELLRKNLFSSSINYKTKIFMFFKLLV